MSILIPTRFRLFRKKFQNVAFNLLDVGAGSHSASLTKHWFSRCNYYGIDRTKAYGNDERDFELMTKFYEIDLTKLEFGEIPNDYFDVLMMSHVIEHLPDGDQVIMCLLPKLKKGGVIYIEFPSPRSVKFPSMRGTLNFYDDDTHCRLYTLDEVANILATNGCTILQSGTRRDWVRILATPLMMIYSKIKYGFVAAGVFWDLLGFAEYIYAEKR